MSAPSDWGDAALHPPFLRPNAPAPPPRPPLTREGIRNLTHAQARLLSGRDLDRVHEDGLVDTLGSKWLMQEQECDYNPPREQIDGSIRSFDVAILMVDDRPPLPYMIPNTGLASPAAWGSPRVSLSHAFLPSHWGTLSAEQADLMTVEVMAAGNFASRPVTTAAATVGDGLAAAAGSNHGRNDAERADDDNDKNDDRADGVGGWSADTASHSRTTQSDEANQPRVLSFHLALIINHIFAQLHSHTFYLEAPCVNASLGVDAAMWNRSVSRALTSGRHKFSARYQKFLRHQPVCAPLPSSHRLGPFPPRPAAWAKLAAIRYVARRHAFVLYVDSDAFITRVWQPIAPLVELLGLHDGRKWLAVSGEWPPQKLRRDQRAGVANSGVLLLAGAPTAGAGVLRMLESWIWPSKGLPLATFYWPYEQNALTYSLIHTYANRVALLRPGCPFNSPFGAYVRHYVGGTPDRAVYHPHHRAAWLLAALRCTVALVAAAATPPTESAAGLRGDAGSALRHREGCAANEPTLTLPAPRATCGENDGAGVGQNALIERDVQPMGATVLSRLTASWWRACCAFCLAHPTCAAWSFHEDWPADSINCVLLGHVNHSVPAYRGDPPSARAAKYRSTYRQLLGRLADAVVRRRSMVSPGRTRAGEDDDVVRSYRIPADGPWDGNA